MTRTWCHIWPGAMWKTLRISQPGHHRISFAYRKIPTGLRTPQATSTILLYVTQQWWLILLEYYLVFDASLVLSFADNFLWIKKNKRLFLRHQCCNELRCRSLQIKHHLFSPSSPGGEKTGIQFNMLAGVRAQHGPQGCADSSPSQQSTPCSEHWKQAPIMKASLQWKDGTTLHTLPQEFLIGQNLFLFALSSSYAFTTLKKYN